MTIFVISWHTSLTNIANNGIITYVRLYYSLANTIEGVDAMSSNTSNNNRNEKGELEFELSPIQRYDVTFVNKSKGKLKVHEIDEKAKARAKEKGKGKGRAKVKGEYKYTVNTITVEMDDDDIRELAKDLNVLSIEPDYLCNPIAVYSQPFHENVSWMFEQTKASVAYANGISGQGVKVAVLDSGVDTDNPMLTHAIKGGTSVVSWSSNYEDLPTHGHGTMVCGAIAGKYQGKPYGIAPDVDLYAVKVVFSEEEDRGATSDITKGIEWAIDNGMNAINISFDTVEITQAFRNAIQRAYNSGIPVFYASGNSGVDYDTSNSNRCTIDGIYCVSALSKSNSLTDFSTYGVRNLAFAMYGGSVPVVEVGSSNPEVADGTSFASPITMGMFALYKCKYPNMSTNDIIEHMTTNAVNVSELSVKPVAKLPIYENNVTTVTSQTPQTPTLSVVSTIGRTVVVRASVPSSSAPFDKLSIDYKWVGGTEDKIVTTSKTRHYDFVIEAPNFNTTYQVSVRVANGSLNSGWSSTFSFTTGSATSNVAPSRPTISLLSTSGLNATFRVTVPITSPEFDSVTVDYYWVSTPYEVFNTPHTRSYDFTVAIPSYNTDYKIDVKANNSNLSSAWSIPLTFNIADENSTLAPTKPTLSVVSINGKSVTFRVSVHSSSAMFDRVMIGHSWGNGFTDESFNISKTRSYDFTLTPPNFNTEYSINGIVYNNGKASPFGDIIYFTTGAENTPVAPVAPTLTLLSVNGRNANIRATVPSSSATFNKLQLDYRWVSGASNDAVLTMPNTRSHDFTVTAPAFGTTYQIDAMAYNGNLNSGWSNVLSFTTGSDTSPVAPSTPTISLVSVNGKTVKLRVTVPSTSATFNKLQFDYYWVSGTSDSIITMSSTRSYDVTIEVPNFNTQYQIDVKAFNGDLSSSWSPALTFTSGSGATNTILEDFSDDNLNFTFFGGWYRDTATNTYRSGAIGHGETSATILYVPTGRTGGTLSIDYKTSSEANYDFFEIVVNDTLYARYSGVSSTFQTATINMPASTTDTQVVGLRYVKDGSASSGDDCVYIDNVRFTTY